ncbi:unnamed protein product [Gongylonema pulchrum]|uniref:Q_MOTIF domain-containing protein n=1 Tax=Gongylonema pulchrum TaxID=637853 RepID=A0A183DKE2_9BILA|nr:unnamed protein product [Gongylonema pulchrum]
MDVNAQKKQKSEFYANLMEKRRTKEEKHQEELRLAGVKKKEKKEAFDNRHWTQKSLEQMTERDWRIFREDFNISIKGGRVPKPLRNWEEAGLPPEVYNVIMKIGYQVRSPFLFFYFLPFDRRKVKHRQGLSCMICSFVSMVDWHWRMIGGQN